VGYHTGWAAKIEFRHRGVTLLKIDVREATWPVNCQDLELVLISSLASVRELYGNQLWNACLDYTTPYA
jgi:hypothetical protein